ncbi:integrator complex subunit 9-like [Chenopodium quinoa]|uniref:Beta-Casp domain-containing protein n=1 Tax=Chenopodium quinoa TaxID=63459 RepID=A0A803MYD4_CHEQI|nr:integrator complex subunit 9-like [Chenopodium quinoa]
MKLTCLSKGQGYYFPPCHIIEISGFRILVDCPLDLSALLIFAPVPVYSERRLEYAFDCSCHASVDTDCAAHSKQKVDNSLDASSLIHGVPWYKTVSNLHLWDVSFIDVVLISSPMGMLGLPFLTRNKNFVAKIYATEATTRIGQLMMEDFLSMHREFRQFYGPEDSGCANWMKWEELVKFPPSIQEIILGKEGTELGGWLPLYSAADVKDCIQKVQSLKYAEETCYSGLLIIKAFSSGLDIGTSNWEIKSPKKDVVLISSSILDSAPALSFDYHALQGHDLVLFSDFSSLDNMEDVDEETDQSAPINENAEVASILSLSDRDGSSEEEQKLEFICSYAIDSLKAGGSVLIPIGRIGVVLQLLEQISVSEELLNLKVPIFFISSVAEELLSYTTIIPEWLCVQRQKKLFAGEPLFAHVDLIKEKRLHLLSSICTTDLLKIWQEPCIVFAPHWNLRLGPVVHFLKRWHENENSLLVLEKALDADLALLPFKPLAMKVLQCSFLSGIRTSKVAPLIQKLQPKFVLLPENLKALVDPKSISVIYYTENIMLRVPSLKRRAEVEIPTDLVSQYHWISLEEEDINITRLKGELSVEHGKYRLLTGKESKGTCIDFGRLSTALQDMGFKITVGQGAIDGSGKSFDIHVHEPSNALIKVRPTITTISTSDKDLASSIYKAVDSILYDI